MTHIEIQRMSRSFFEAGQIEFDSFGMKICETEYVSRTSLYLGSLHSVIGLKLIKILQIYVFQSWRFVANCLPHVPSSRRQL